MHTVSLPGKHDNINFEERSETFKISLNKRQLLYEN